MLAKNAPYSMIKYRADIDGLRAFAILSVFIYHLNPSWLYGGFIGVDVFFVISGYLITRIIIRENQQNKFSFVNFYGRRIKRIFPVLFFVLAIIALVAVFSFPDITYKTFVKTFRYASAQFSNFFFAKEIDYFSESNELQPLLHTWSLAVEEQFYLVWPFLIFLCYKIAKYNIRYNILFIFFTVIILSFFTGYILTYAAPKYAFYMFFTRAWEFCIGGIFALDLIPNIKNKRANNFTAVFGFVLMIASFIFIREGIDFVKGAVIVPVIGAGLIIYTAQQDETWISRFLSLKPIVYIGLISYSMYLWHWPVIIFYKQLFEVKELSVHISLILVLITLILSLISYYFLEQPARKVKLKNILALFLGALFIGIFMASSFWLQEQTKVKWRVGIDFSESDFIANRCFDFTRKQFNNINLDSCTTGSNKDNPEVLLIGDSHAEHYRDMVYLWAKEQGKSLRTFAAGSCRIALGYEHKKLEKRLAPLKRPKCIELNKFLSRHLKEAKYYQYIIFAVKNYNVIEIEEERKRLRELLSATIEYTHDDIPNFIILSQVPWLKENPMKCLQQPLLKKWVGKQKCNTSFSDEVMQKAKKEETIYQDLAKNYGVKVFDPRPYFFKSIMNEGKTLLRDSDHLSGYGSRYLAPYFIEFMEKEFDDENKSENTKEGD